MSAEKLVQISYFSSKINRAAGLYKNLSKDGLKISEARIHDSTNCLWGDLYVKK